MVVEKGGVQGANRENEEVGLAGKRLGLGLQLQVDVLGTARAEAASSDGAR